MWWRSFKHTSIKTLRFPSSWLFPLLFNWEIDIVCNSTEWGAAVGITLPTFHWKWNLLMKIRVIISSVLDSVLIFWILIRLRKCEEYKNWQNVNISNKEIRKMLYFFSRWQPWEGELLLNYASLPQVSLIFAENTLPKRSYHYVPR